MNSDISSTHIPRDGVEDNHRVFPWLMIFSRSFLFFAIQAFFALIFFLMGSYNAWNDGANWWPFVVSITNGICIWIMSRLFRLEGKGYWEIFRIRRENVKSDLLVMLGILVIAAPVSFLPNILLAGWLFGDAQQALSMLIRPLPFWAAYAGILLFPLTQGLAEIPTYFIYSMPRLKAQGLPQWLAIAIPSLLLGLQHFAVPCLFDVRYITWRVLMFLPFAFLLGIVLNWRPRLLPYIAIIHVLMDFSFAVMLLGAAYA